MRDSFIIYTSYKEKYAVLSDEQFGKLFRAILEYQASGEVPQINDGMVSLAFGTIRYDIDRNNENYERVCEKRRLAGAKGGEAKATKSKQMVANGSKCYQKVAKGGKTWHNDNEYDNDNDNDNDVVYIPTGINNNKRKDNKLSQREKSIPADDLNEIVARWNTLPSPIPKLTVLKAGSKRYESLSARIAEYGIDNVMIAIEKIRLSSFLTGKSAKWHISFDWFVLPNNFPKVLDGNYTDSEADQKPKQSRAFSIIDDMIARGELEND